MFDKELALEVLKQILEAVKMISVRFRSIEKLADFTDSPEGDVKFIAEQLLREKREQGGIKSASPPLNRVATLRWHKVYQSVLNGSWVYQATGFAGG